MTLPIPDHSTLWDRTLPKPTALLQNHPNGPIIGSRSSSLLQHHIVSDKFPRDSVDFGGRRSTVPCIEYQRRSPSPRGVDSVIDPKGAPGSNGTIPEPLLRKKSASHMAEASRSSEPSPPSPSASETLGQFCLCQPEAKIPRPRNAFILYRQHHQAAVVSQNPGIPNPDISKIIGEQWRSLAAKTKNEWKALAEEEKARHQQQYPDYRYQPRRNGRYSNLSSISGPSSGGSIDPQGNCLKCGGKMMNLPNTPYPPFTPVTASAPQMIGLPPLRRPYSVAAPQNGRPQMQQVLVSPQSARIRPYAEVFGRPAPVDSRARYPTSQPGPSTPMIIDSPDPKRRRFNGASIFVPIEGQIYNDNGYQYSPRTSSFSKSEAFQPRTTMALPTRNTYTQPPRQLQSQQYQKRRDPSLTLPALKTSPPEPQKAQSPKSSLEAMIMSIPVLNKIKTLCRISPHLAAPGVVTPPYEVRGAIIAVEGIDPKSVNSMTNSLTDHLEKEGTFAVRTFSGPDPYESFAERSATITTEIFLTVISKWHKISRDMVQFITTAPVRPSDVEIECPEAAFGFASSETGLNRRTSISQNLTAIEGVSDSAPSLSEPSSVHVIEIDAPNTAESASTELPVDANSAVSPRTLDQTAVLSISSSLDASQELKTTEVQSLSTPADDISRRTYIPTQIQTPSPGHQSAGPEPPRKTQCITSKSQLLLPTPPPLTPTAIPIAIVPHYQLTTVDTSSIAMPITDSYSPINHWQWLASLWRGCVGPDVTVVIKDVESEAESVGVNGTKTDGPAEKVECRLLDSRAIIVNTSIRDSGEAGESSINWEKAKRRVGFEVEEFLRK